MQQGIEHMTDPLFWAVMVVCAIFLIVSWAKGKLSK